MHCLVIDYYDGRPSETITEELDVLRNFADDFRYRDVDKLKARRVVRETWVHLGHHVVVYYFPLCKKTYYID